MPQNRPPLAPTSIPATLTSAATHDALIRQHGPSISPPEHPDRLDHAARWLAHVEAGRIGSFAPPSSEHLARHIRNARVLAGGGR